MIILRRLIVVVLALSCLGLGVYAYNEHGARVAAEDLARSLQSKNTALHKAQAARPIVPVVAEATFPAGMPTPASAPEGGRTGPRPSQPGGPMRATPADFIGMMDNPEIQQLMNLRSRGALDGRYAALFKSLGLRPDQLQKFQDLLLDKQNTMRDVVAAMRSQGLMPNAENRDQVRTLMQNANEELDGQIRSTLGEAAYTQYQEYERTQPQRATVERVQQRLSYSSQPLTDQQATQLVSLLAQDAQSAANAGGGGGNRRMGPGGPVASAPISDQALAQAGSILSPAQLTTLQEMQQEQQAQAQLSRRARETFTGSRPATPAGN